MSNQSDVYYQSMSARSEVNRRVIMLMLLSKLALVLFIGVIYAVSGL
jgi:hypothetical protein